MSIKECYELLWNCSLLIKLRQLQCPFIKMRFITLNNKTQQPVTLLYTTQAYNTIIQHNCIMLVERNASAHYDRPSKYTIINYHQICFYRSESTFNIIHNYVYTHIL